MLQIKGAEEGRCKGLEKYFFHFKHFMPSLFKWWVLAGMVSTAETETLFLYFKNIKFSTCFIAGKTTLSQRIIQKP